MLGIKPDIGLTRRPSMGSCLGKQASDEALLGGLGTPQLRRCWFFRQADYDVLNPYELHRRKVAGCEYPFHSLIRENFCNSYAYSMTRNDS